MRNKTFRQFCLNVAAAAVLAVGIACLAPTGHAVEVAELYTAQVPLDPRNPDSRNDAYSAALKQVLVRVTGARDAAQSELLQELFPDASRYVLQYRPGENNSLWVALDGAAIEDVLRRGGQTVWSHDRPLTLVWLAVDWGQGEREIVGADDADRSPGAQRSINRNRLLRERLQDAAGIRGLPIAFPLLDTEDLANISFSDIWGGFDERLLRASERYGADAVLIGRVRPAAAQPYRWTYHLGPGVFEYSGEPAEVLNQVADSLVAEYAFAGDAPLQAVSLTVSGIDSIAAYGAVQQIMDSLNPVESYSIEDVAGNRIHYLVQVYGGAERLRRALLLTGRLEPGSGFDRGIDAGSLPQFDSLEFAYRP